MRATAATRRMILRRCRRLPAGPPRELRVACRGCPLAVGRAAPPLRGRIADSHMLLQGAHATAALLADRKTTQGTLSATTGQSPMAAWVDLSVDKQTVSHRGSPASIRITSASSTTRYPTVATAENSGREQALVDQPGTPCRARRRTRWTEASIHRRGAPRDRLLLRHRVREPSVSIARSTRSGRSSAVHALAPQAMGPTSKQRLRRLQESVKISDAAAATRQLATVAVRKGHSWLAEARGHSSTSVALGRDATGRQCCAASPGDVDERPFWNWSANRRV